MNSREPSVDLRWQVGCVLSNRWHRCSWFHSRCVWITTPHIILNVYPGETLRHNWFPLWHQIVPPFRCEGSWVRGLNLVAHLLGDVLVICKSAVASWNDMSCFSCYGKSECPNCWNGWQQDTLLVKEFVIILHRGTQAAANRGWWPWTERSWCWTDETVTEVNCSRNDSIQDLPWTCESL